MCLTQVHNSKVWEGTGFKPPTLLVNGCPALLIVLYFSGRISAH